MNPDDSLTTERLIREIQEMAGEKCPHCDGAVSLIDALKSRALGSRRRPKCFAGLADHLAIAPDQLELQITEYFAQRDCYRGALEWVHQQSD